MSFTRRRRSFAAPLNIYHDSAQFVLRCAFGAIGNLQKAIEARGIESASAEMEYVCLAPTALGEDEEREVMATIAAIEEDEDVQRVFHTLA